ncbi:Hypothetical protein MCB1EB_0525 [Mycoavidus cysteinexigens]|uniref:Uncharacterized protein n=1 Tax=Mycoavidus cysteinexigens TaxID=1553431 RepID=A0A2Z6ETF8_9BURK|nr:hypothetical protein [Mycoavidus cysteinexigens]BBE08686.1 Hypothetical protein MCB1EB_0525 [Mycoavidus cysteinexigens]GAM52604.1 hypothetical protein EBME_1067 [bacterium endosymbiont of Mortierella elongata FMR23-6]GLR01452.1 hypothetical protein GCM10007934_12640 [Mycoavidus cysteinexigens]
MKSNGISEQKYEEEMKMVEIQADEGLHNLCVNATIKERDLLALLLPQANL